MHYISPTDEPVARARFRRTNIYGNVLAGQLGADWINISLPAMSNQWMCEQFNIVKKIRNTLPYDKVFVVITLTELCRELRPNRPDSYNVDISRLSSINDLFVDVSNHITALLLDQLPNNIELKIARNYVDNSYGPLLDPYMVNDSWIDIIQDKIGAPKFDNKSFILVDSVMTISNLEHQFNMTRDNFIDEVQCIISAAQQRLNLLEKSQYNIQKLGYRHPNVEGHALWADHLYTKFAEFRFV